MSIDFDPADPEVATHFKPVIAEETPVTEETSETPVIAEEIILPKKRNVYDTITNSLSSIKDLDDLDKYSENYKKYAQEFDQYKKTLIQLFDNNSQLIEQEKRLGCNYNEKIVENVKAFIDAVVSAKPPAAKGTYMKKISLTSTMGPGLKIDKANIA